MLCRAPLMPLFAEGSLSQPRISRTWVADLALDTSRVTAAPAICRTQNENSMRTRGRMLLKRKTSGGSWKSVATFGDVWQIAFQLDKKSETRQRDTLSPRNLQFHLGAFAPPGTKRRNSAECTLHRLHRFKNGTCYILLETHNNSIIS